MALYAIWDKRQGVRCLPIKGEVTSEGIVRWIVSLPYSEL
ncbi:hypothetical protein GCM10007928_52330 [Sulfitobacter porphyrae]|nr:hypothetical protein GCM10007928_52330 [Sulfitobacter porphyrae]